MKKYILIPLLFFILAGCETSTNLTSTETDLKVAFIGDQGVNSNAQAVLQLILNEGADLVLHQGDFDYLDDAQSWESQINLILGENFPYFASVGNHDVAAIADYQQVLTNRISRITDANCSGDVGVNMTCIYKGLFFILSGVGSHGSNHESYLESQLSHSTNLWRICSWHKNQRLMQVGGKTDEVGWQAYETCLAHGAIIATGHEHSYSRTHLMSSFINQTVDSTSNSLAIENGKTFAFVSGLGGHSIRAQDDELAGNNWWASVYSSTQNATYGALFCTFNVGGIAKNASCYFKDIDGNIPDEFSIVNNLQ